MENKDQFIDAESSSYSKEGNSFHDILLRQIRKTSDILSRDLSTGVYFDQESKKIYPEDRRMAGMNHVRTTYSLMKPLIKEGFEEEITKLKEDFGKFQDRLGKTKVLIQGQGEVEASQIFHDSKSIPYIRLINYKLGNVIKCKISYKLNGED